MAHRKAAGTASNLKDSPGQRLGLKKASGEKVVPGNILVRQQGKKYRAGKNVRYGKDFTLFATAEGKVAFTKKKVKKFNGKREETTFVEVT